jgi:GMP synthase PP-ATPase subunit
MKTSLITLSAIAFGLSVSCKEKSPEVKKIEQTTANAVAEGKMTKDEAKTVNKAAQNADEMKAEAKEMADKQLAALEKATTPEEMKAAIRDATKANIDLAVKSGMMVKEQAELSLKSLDSIDALPEPLLKQTVEQLKAALKQVQSQTK